MARRLVIADDQAAFRDGIRAMLAVVPDIEVVGEASTGLEARRGERWLAVVGGHFGQPH